MSNSERINKNNNELDNIKSMLENKSSIIERIENENGTAIKFYDGTMICKKKIKLGNINYNNSYGSIYHGGSYTWNYPVEFIDDMDLAVSVNVELNGGIGGSTIIKSTTNNARYYLYSVNQYTLNTDVNVIAIGRWK